MANGGVGGITHGENGKADVLNWEAADHIESLKATLDSVATCDAHDPLTRATIYNTRCLGAFSVKLSQMSMQLNSMPETVADLVVTRLRRGGSLLGDQVEHHRKTTWSGLMALGVPTPVCILLFLVGKSWGWW